MTPISTAAPPEPAASERLAAGRARRYALSVAAGLAARALPPALSLAVTPYALAELGAERFGLYALATSAVAWLTLADPGLAAGLRVVLARRSARLDPAELGPLFGAARGGQAALAALTLAAGAALAWAAPALFVLPAELAGEARLLFGLLAAGLAATVAAQASAAALEACQLAHAERAARIVRAVARAALLVVLLRRGWGLAAAGAAQIGAAAAGSLTVGLARRRLLPELAAGASKPSFESLRALVSPGVWLSAGALAGVLIQGLDRAVAARWLSLEAVAAYSLTAAVYSLAEAVLGQAIDAARPALGQALGAGRRGEARRIYAELTRLAAAGGAAAALALAAANRAFVETWAGAEAYGGGWLDFWLAAGLWLNLWSLPHRALLGADLRAKAPSLLRLGEGGLNLALSIAWAAPFGLAGIAAGTVVAGAAVSLWSLPALAAAALGEDGPAGALRGAAAVGLAAAPLAWAARSLASGYTGAATAALAAGFGGLAAAWLFVLDGEERRRIVRRLAALRQERRWAV